MSRTSRCLPPCLGRKSWDSGFCTTDSWHTWIMAVLRVKAVRAPKQRVQHSMAVRVLHHRLCPCATKRVEENNTENEKTSVSEASACSPERRQRLKTYRAQQFSLCLPHTPAQETWFAAHSSLKRSCLHAAPKEWFSVEERETASMHQLTSSPPELTKEAEFGLRHGLRRFSH